MHQAGYEQVKAELGADYADAWAQLMACGKCGRKTRPVKAKTAAWPHTATRAVRGACSRCYAQGYRPSNPPEPSGMDFLKNPPVLVLQQPAVVDHVAPSRRRAMAVGWDDTQRSAAELVVSYVPDAPAATEILDMLGLFDDDPTAYSSSYAMPQNLKGFAENGAARKSHYE